MIISLLLVVVVVAVGVVVIVVVVVVAGGHDVKLSERPGVRRAGVAPGFRRNRPANPDADHGTCQFWCYQHEADQVSLGGREPGRVLAIRVLILVYPSWA